MLNHDMLGSTVLHEGNCLGTNHGSGTTDHKGRRFTQLGGLQHPTAQEVGFPRARYKTISFQGAFGVIYKTVVGASSCGHYTAGGSKAPAFGHKQPAHSVPAAGNACTTHRRSCMLASVALASRVPPTCLAKTNALEGPLMSVFRLRCFLAKSYTHRYIYIYTYIYNLSI